MTDQTLAAAVAANPVLQATEYKRQAIWLPQFAALHFKAQITVIKDKLFEECVFEGPAVLMGAGGLTFDGCDMGGAEDVRSLMLAPVGPMVTGVVPFQNCSFVRCRFARIGYTGHPDFLRDLETALRQPRHQPGAAS